METRRLGYFVRVAEDGSLTRAAGVLRVAQPALSRQMRILEEELGVSLFVRTPRGMRLTEAGEQLRAAVAGPLRELELALANVRSTQRRSLGNLAIGMTPGMAEVIGEALGIRLVREFANAAIRIVEGPTGALADWLGRGMVDLALLEEASRDPRLADQPLVDDGIWIVGPAEARLSDYGTFAFDRLHGLPLILPSHHLGLRTVVDAVASQTDRLLDIKAHADVPRLARQLVTAGLGYALLPSAYCRPPVLAGELSACPIAAPRLAITYHLTTRRAARSVFGLLERVEEVVSEEVTAAFRGGP